MKLWVVKSTQNHLGKSAECHRVLRAKLKIFALVNVSVGQMEQKLMPCAMQHIKVSLNCTLFKQEIQI